MSRFVFVALLLASVPLQAASVRWIGVAQDVRQVTTIAVTGTWATGDTATLTINNKNVTVTIGADVSTSNVADVLARAVDAANGTENLLNDESRNFGGEEIPEFAEVDADADGATLTLSSETPGVPFTVTRSESTAGDGALGAVTSVTAATGKNHFDNAKNWEGGSLPSATDTLVFDSGSVDVLYGLGNATLDYALRRTNGYTGDIGLPKINPNGYAEYRTRFLALPVTATTGSVIHHIGGEVESAASGRTYLDFGTNDPSEITAFIRDAPAAGDDGAAVQLVGGKDLSLAVFRGSVGVGTNVGQNATILTAVATRNSTGDTSADVSIGTAASFRDAANSVEVASGSITLACDCDGGSNEILCHGGVLKVESTVAVNVIYVYGGRVDFRGSEIATCHVYSGGELDLSSAGAVVFTNPVELYRGFTFRDPLFRMQGLGIRFDFNGCTSADGTLQLRNNLSLVPAGL